MMETHYITPPWPAPAPIKAVTTTRCGGFSQTPFHQFNLAAHVNDDPLAVEKNRQKLMHDLEIKSKPMWLQQVHGTKAIELTASQSINLPPCADASITRFPDMVCAILTADCLPILLCNRLGNEVAAIHAGWRGLLAGVIENTISLMQSAPGELMAWLGPAIGPQHFEINADIAAHFTAKQAIFAQGLAKPYPQRWFADLFTLATLTLQACQVNNIFSDNLCTYTDESRFYSHRRDQGNTGRMASLIWISGSR